MRLGSYEIERDRLGLAVTAPTVGVALWLLDSVRTGTTPNWWYVAVTWVFLLCLLVAVSIERESDGPDENGAGP